MSGLAGKARANSATSAGDPTGRTDQSGKSVQFYPSARTLNTADRQQSAIRTFPEAKPADKNANPNPNPNSN